MHRVDDRVLVFVSTVIDNALHVAGAMATGLEKPAGEAIAARAILGAGRWGDPRSSA